ncbi:beta strand repeat-containing protein [Limnovirga soli]|nr:lamin tail domain-containing protein [Limnovirga soli]
MPYRRRSIETSNMNVNDIKYTITTRLLQLLLLVLCASISFKTANAQFNTGAIAIDGAADAAYITSGLYSVAWDNTYLYINYTGGANSTDPVVAYFDINPAVPVAGGGTAGANGNPIGVTYNSITPTLPFLADFMIYWQGTGSAVEWRKTDIAGAWSAATAFAPGDRFIGTPNREIRIAWTNMGLAGRPTSFNWLVAATSIIAPRNTYNALPSFNPGGSVTFTGTTPLDNYYFSVTNTAQGTAVSPFSQISYESRATATFAQAATTLWDYTVEGASTTNTFSPTGTITLNNALFIAISNTFLVGTGASRNLTLGTTATQTPSITCNGALTPNSGTGILNITAAFGTTTISGSAANTAFKIGNLTVNKKATVQAPATGTVDLGWDGTNNTTFNVASGGILNFVNAGGGVINVTTSSTRCQVSNKGTMTFNSLSNITPTILKPLDNSKVSIISVKGNFSNTGSFQSAPTVNASLDVIMNGTAAQTLSAELYQNLTIANTAANVTVVAGSLGFLQIANTRVLTINPTARLDLGTFKINISSATASVSGFLRSANTANNTFTTSSAASFVFTSTGTYEHNMNAGTIPAVTWNTGSTCLIMGATANSPVAASLNQTFSNFTWNCPSQNATINLTGNLTTVNGNLSVLNTGTAPNGLRLTNNSFTMALGGDLIVSAATGISSILDLIGGAGNTATLNIGGNISLTNTGGTVTLSKSSGSANINFTKTTGTQTFTQTNATIKDNIGWNVGNGATVADTLQLLTNVDLGTGTGTFTVLANSAVDFQTFTLSGSGPFTANTSASLISANTDGGGAFTTSGATGSIRTSGTRTYTNTGVSYAFTGSTAQVAGNAVGAASINNFTINNSVGVTLTNNINITGNLTLTNGKITTNTKTVTLANSATGSANSYIIADATGTVTMTGITTAKTIPVGTASSYAPLIITSASSASYTVFVNTTLPCASVNPTLNFAWNINSTAAPASVTFQWNSADQNSGFITNGICELNRYTSACPYTTTTLTAATGSGPYKVKANTGFTSGANTYVIGTDPLATSITTPAASFGPFCNTATNNISLAYTSTGTFAGNYFVQISDAAGVFTAVTTGATIISSGTTVSPITATIPAGLLAGTGYRVRVINDNPATFSGNDNGTDIVINSAVAIGANPSTVTVTSPAGANFAVANITGAVTGYQWQVSTDGGFNWSNISGGVYTGETTAALAISSSTGLNGNQYRCVITGSCSSATSSGATLVVNTASPIWSNTITGTTPNTSNPYTDNDITVANITVSGIGRGDATTVGADANDRYNANNWNVSSFDANKYFEFTLTPNSGYKIDFTNLVYTAQASATGPTNFSFRSSADGYVNDIATTTLTTGDVFGLSAASFQGVTTAITFRLYAWGASSAAGTFSVNDFIFNGSVSVTCTLPNAVIANGNVTPQITTISQSGFAANWAAAAGNTDYKLDVSTSATFTTTGSNATDLFISEYVEGSSFNKYIEIYNGTGATVNLANYKLQLYSNGSSTVTNEVTLSGNLNNGSTIVYANTSATKYLGTVQTSSAINQVINYNGDDAVALYKISTNAFVDIFGRIGEDPGASWTSGSFSTLDKTLVRNANVTGGITTNPTAGFPTLATEWTQFATDNVANLGSHTYNGGSVPSFVTGYNNLSIAGTATASQIVCGLSDATTYYYRVRATSTCGTSGNSNVVALTTGAAATYVWAGTTDADWNTATNWTACGIPVTSKNITIPLTTNKPVLPVANSNNITIDSIDLATNATLALSTNINNTFTINGKISGGGKFIGSANANLTIGGTNKSTPAGTLAFSSYPASLNNLTLDRTMSVNNYALLLGGDLTTNSVTFNNGILAIGNNLLSTTSTNGSAAAVSAWVSGTDSVALRQSFVALCDGSGNPITTKDGTKGFRINSVGNVEKFLPVGYNFTSSPNRISLKNDGTADNYTITMFKGDIGGTPLPRVNRIWHVVEGTAGGSNVSMKLFFLKRLGTYQSVQDEVEDGFVWTDARLLHRIVDATTGGFANTSGGGTNGANDIFNFTSNGNNTEIFAAYTFGNSGDNTGAQLANGITDFSGLANFSVANSGTIILPVNFVQVKAWQLGTQVKIEWKVGAEINTNHYEIERAGDGINFNTILTVRANGSSNYQSTDALPLAAANYYRIKAVDKDGYIIQSQIVLVKTGNLLAGIAIYPNPVKQRIAMVQFTNMPAATYTLVVFGVNGVRLLQTQIVHTGGGAAYPLVLPSTWAHGIYQLYMVGNNYHNTQKIVVE